MIARVNVITDEYIDAKMRLDNSTINCEKLNIEKF